MEVENGCIVKVTTIGGSHFPHPWWLWEEGYVLFLQRLLLRNAWCPQWESPHLPPQNRSWCRHQRTKATAKQMKFWLFLKYLETFQLWINTIPNTQCMIYLPTFPIKLTNQMWVNIYSIHWVSGHVFPVTSWCQIKGPSKVEMTGGATVSPFRSTASTSPSQSAQAPFLPCHNKLQISSNI